MVDKKVSKIAALFIVILFFGMIMSSAFQGGNEEPDISVTNYGIIGLGDGNATLYIKLQNNLDSQTIAGVTVKLNEETINQDQVTLGANKTKELTYDINYQFQHDLLYFSIEDEDGEQIGKVERAISNYDELR